MGFSKSVSSLIDNNTKTDNLGHGKERFQHFGERGYGAGNYVVPEISDNIGDCLESVEPAREGRNAIECAESWAFNIENEYCHQIFVMSRYLAAMVMSQFNRLVSKFAAMLDICNRYVLRVIESGLEGIWDDTQKASRARQMEFVDSQDADGAVGIEPYFDHSVIDKATCIYGDYSVVPYMSKPYANSLAPSWGWYNSRLFAPAKLMKPVHDEAVHGFVSTVTERINDYDPYDDELFQTQRKSYLPEKVNIAAFPEHEMSAASRCFNETVANTDDEYRDRLMYLDEKNEAEKRRTRMCSLHANLSLINEMRSQMPSYDLYRDCGVPRGMAYEDSILGVTAKIKLKIDQALEIPDMAYLYDAWKADFQKTLYKDVTDSVAKQNSNQQPEQEPGETEFAYYYRLNYTFLPPLDLEFSQVQFYGLDRYIYRNKPIDTGI